MLLGGAAAAQPADQALRLGMFGDVNAGYDSEAAVPAFALGQVDLFATANPGAGFQALAEVVFEAGSDQVFVVDVERVQLRWSLSDALNVTAGRMHQTLGLYNTTYHHGTFLMTSATRPRVVAFEDEGGVLPVHLVGLSVAGEADLRALYLGYVLEVGNGRGAGLDQVLSVSDLNLSKSVNGQLYARLSGIDLQVGANLLWDRVPALEENGAVVRAPFDEWIVGGHALFRHRGFAASAEAYWIRHLGGGIASSTFGAFLELELRAGTWVPYVRGEVLTFSGTADPFFSPGLPRPGELMGVGGVRFDAGEGVAIKLQGQVGQVGGALAGSAMAQAAFSY